MSSRYRLDLSVWLSSSPRKLVVQDLIALLEDVGGSQYYDNDDKQAARDACRALTYLLLPPTREVVTLDRPAYIRGDSE